jgi:alpha-tubulin suppressor-like RCC1 family protein
MSEKRSIIDVISGAGHTIAMDCFGNLFSWGASNDAQTGHGKRSDIVKPKKIESI